MPLLVQVFLAVWLVATGIRQLNADWFVNSVPSCLLDYLPLWTFFAPNPGTADIRLLYRDRQDNSSNGEWIECCRRPHVSAWRFLWNPHKLEEKAVIDLALLLLRAEMSFKADPDVLMITWPYLVLLSRTISEPTRSRRGERQFSILATEGLTEPRAIRVHFVSRWHGLEG
jgi:hypothetical protein